MENYCSYLDYRKLYENTNRLIIKSRYDDRTYSISQWYKHLTSGLVLLINQDSVPSDLRYKIRKHLGTIDEYIPLLEEVEPENIYQPRDLLELIIDNGPGYQYWVRSIRLEDDLYVYNTENYTVMAKDFDIDI